MFNKNLLNISVIFDYAKVYIIKKLFILKRWIIWLKELVIKITILEISKSLKKFFWKKFYDFFSIWIGFFITSCMKILYFVGIIVRFDGQCAEDTNSQYLATDGDHCVTISIFEKSENVVAATKYSLAPKSSSFFSFCTPLVFKVNENAH